MKVANTWLMLNVGVDPGVPWGAEGPRTVRSALAARQMPLVTSSTFATNSSCRTTESPIALTLWRRGAHCSLQALTRAIPPNPRLPSDPPRARLAPPVVWSLRWRPRDAVRVRRVLRRGRPLWVGWLQLGGLRPRPPPLGQPRLDGRRQPPVAEQADHRRELSSEPFPAMNGDRARTIHQAHHGPSVAAVLTNLAQAIERTPEGPESTTTVPPGRSLTRSPGPGVRAGGQTPRRVRTWLPQIINGLRGQLPVPESPQAPTEHPFSASAHGCSVGEVLPPELNRDRVGA
jgi:hypothetical protein